jgi:phosphoribosylformylglycinamidine cyclo-ligase
MARTFNCGVGMAVIVSQSDMKDVSQALDRAGETVLNIGRIEKGERGCTVAGSRGTWSARDDWSASHHG